MAKVRACIRNLLRLIPPRSPFGHRMTGKLPEHRPFVEPGAGFDLSSQERRPA